MPGFADLDRPVSTAPSAPAHDAWPAHNGSGLGVGADEPDPFRSLWSPDALAATGPADPSALSFWFDDVARDSAKTTRPKTAHEQQLSDDAVWSYIAAKPVNADHAPRHIHLPKAVNDRLDEAYTLSDRENREHCGTIVTDGSGHTKPRTDTVGKSRECQTTMTDHRWRQPVTADYHTHPYDPAVDPAQDQTFSNGDFAAEVDYDDNAAVLRGAHNKTYVLVKTPEFQRIVDEADANDETSELRMKIWDTYQAAYEVAIANGVEESEAQEAGARAAANAFHVLYYAGVGADVDLVAGGSGNTK